MNFEVATSMIKSCHLMRNGQRVDFPSPLKMIINKTESNSVEKTSVKTKGRQSNKKNQKKTNPSYSLLLEAVGELSEILFKCDLQTQLLQMNTENVQKGQIIIDVIEEPSIDFDPQITQLCITDGAINELESFVAITGDIVKTFQGPQIDSVQVDKRKQGQRKLARQGNTKQKQQVAIYVDQDIITGGDSSQQQLVMSDSNGRNNQIEELLDTPILPKKRSSPFCSEFIANEVIVDSEGVENEISMSRRKKIVVESIDEEAEKTPKESQSMRAIEIEPDENGNYPSLPSSDECGRYSGGTKNNSQGMHVTNTATTAFVIEEDDEEELDERVQELNRGIQRESDDSLDRIRSRNDGADQSNNQAEQRKFTALSPEEEVRLKNRHLQLLMKARRNEMLKNDISEVIISSDDDQEEEQQDIVGQPITESVNTPKSTTGKEIHSCSSEEGEVVHVVKKQKKYFLGNDWRFMMDTEGQNAREKASNQSEELAVAGMNGVSEKFQSFQDKLQQIKNKKSLCGSGSNSLYSRLSGRQIEEIILDEASVKKQNLYKVDAAQLAKTQVLPCLPERAKKRNIFDYQEGDQSSNGVVIDCEENKCAGSTENLRDILFNPDVGIEEIETIAEVMSSFQSITMLPVNNNNKIKTGFGFSMQKRQNDLEHQQQQQAQQQLLPLFMNEHLRSGSNSVVESSNSRNSSSNKNNYSIPSDGKKRKRRLVRTSGNGCVSGDGTLIGLPVHVLGRIIGFIDKQQRFGVRLVNKAFSYAVFYCVDSLVFRRQEIPTGCLVSLLDKSKNLKNLVLGGIGSFREEIFVRWHVEESVSSLERLDISGGGFEGLLGRMVQSAREIQELGLPYFSEVIDGEMLKSAVLSLQKLIVLKLSGDQDNYSVNKRVSDELLAEVLTDEKLSIHFKQLSVLNVSPCFFECLEERSQVSVNGSIFDRLEVLKVRSVVLELEGGSSIITGEKVLQVIGKFNQLKSLQIDNIVCKSTRSWFMQYTPTFTAIKEMFVATKATLQNLCVGSWVTNEVMRIIAESAGEIKKIRVKGNTVDDAGMESLLQKMGELEYINVAKAARINGHCFESVISKKIEVIKVAFDKYRMECLRNTIDQYLMLSNVKIANKRQ